MAKVERRDMNAEREKQPVAPRWAPRVPRWKIARLYENDALGIVDEALIEDVAYSLLERCQSMVAVEEAHRGRAMCPMCEAIAEHKWDKTEKLRCGGCGWTGQWETYWKSYKDKHLTAGGLGPYCRGFIRKFPRLRTATARLLAINELIHRFHWEGAKEIPGRAGAICLIGGKSAQEVNVFLQALNDGDASHPEIREVRSRWRDKQQIRLAVAAAKRESREHGRDEKRQRKEAKRKRRRQRAKEAQQGQSGRREKQSA